jgi:hypothetical protein
MSPRRIIPSRLQQHKRYGGPYRAYPLSDSVGPVPSDACFTGQCLSDSHGEFRAVEATSITRRVEANYSRSLAPHSLPSQTRSAQYGLGGSRSGSCRS